MKLNINFYYKQRYLPTKRHRNYRERKLSGTTTVTIKELTAEEFPIAFIIHDMKSVCEGMKDYYGYESAKCDFRMFDEEIRTFKGKLYSPIRVTHGAAISTEFETVEDMIWNIENGAARDFWLPEATDFTENSVIIDDNSKSIIKILRSNPYANVYFDGKFWRQISEPRYVINTFGLGHNHGGTGFFIEYSYNPNISNKNYFSALQRDEAIAYGKAVATRRGDTESVEGMGDHDVIEVVMPEMVKVKPNKQHGNGCEFMNMMEGVISKSENIGEAGLLCLALAMSGI